jgi:hypothetical protein
MCKSAETESYIRYSNYLRDDKTDKTKRDASLV